MFVCASAPAGPRARRGPAHRAAAVRNARLCNPGRESLEPIRRPVLDRPLPGTTASGAKPSAAVSAASCAREEEATAEAFRALLRATAASAGPGGVRGASWRGRKLCIFEYYKG